MAKKDYFVVMYRILDYLYRCLQEGIGPDLDKISAENLEINERYFQDILEELFDKKYIKNASKYKNKVFTDIKLFDNVSITMEGVMFLQENSIMAKAKQALKDIKASVPFI